MGKPVGFQMDDSIEITEAIDALVLAVEKHSAELKGVRGPIDACISENQNLIQKMGENRGRPLFLDYLGSGLGNGCFVELCDGSVKLDLINGIGIHILGHSHPSVIRSAIRASLSDVLIQGNLQANREYVDLAQKLVDLAGRKSRLKHVWITTSGSMANENALKSCRQKLSPAKKVIAMDAAFAGRTSMMAEITDNDSMRVGLPRYNETLRVPFYDKADARSIEKTLELLKKHVAENQGDICAFMFEPMQGEGGYNVAPREYFIPLFEFCKSEKIPVWADEIQTFCRTGEFFAFETLDLGSYIDVCTVAKTMQNAATFYTEDLNPKPGLIAGTFAGSTPSLAVGLEILNTLDNSGYMGVDGKIQKIHAEFVGMLNDLNDGSCKGLLQDAGGLGLMVGVTPLGGSKDKMMALVKNLYSRGLICFGCGRGPFRVRFLIPATITSAEIVVAKKLIENSILELA